MKNDEKLEKSTKRKLKMRKKENVIDLNMLHVHEKTDKDYFAFHHKQKNETEKRSKTETKH